MKKSFSFILIICFFSVLVFSQSFLVGTDDGLYDVSNIPRRLFSNAIIYSIQKVDGVYFFLTDKGIMKSPDLKQYSFLTNGLPQKTLKLEVNKKLKLVQKPQNLKDLAFHPDNKDIFVTATNSAVFLTVNGGKSWQNLGTYGFTNGIKAVAVASLPDKTGENRLTVFVGTSVNGLAWKQPFVNNYWHDANDGLAKGPEGPDEVSDILICKGETGSLEIFLSQTFTSKLYKFNWQTKTASQINSQDKNLSNAKYLDSLNYASAFLTGVKENEIFVKPVLFPKVFQDKYTNALSKDITKSLTGIKLRSAGIFQNLNCAFISKEVFNLNADLSFNELFALRLNEGCENKYAELASGKKAIYMPPYKINNLDYYFDIIEKHNLNAIIIDMKDDWGYIRYNSKKPNITKVGGVLSTVNLEKLVSKAKEKNIYLIARLVIFKDRQLYHYANGAYAVKDYTTGNSWRGYYLTKSGEKNYNYEYWVDPYNENVWAYNTAIANELVERGFDEIQFDYIRFPTDGDNLRNLRYPAKTSEMDKESAIMSFLSYARSHIKAPISIDIYGANGWYRTGARTGQEVEMLAEFVDIICPMYYPSHFGQGFLDYPPREKRPYRIHYHGAYRAKLIARNKTITRPWAQCFFINVSYDRHFYGPYYVKSQITAIEDSIDEGFSFWNASGNYKDIPSLN